MSHRSTWVTQKLQALAESNQQSFLKENKHESRPTPEKNGLAL